METCAGILRYLFSKGDKIWKQKPDWSLNVFSVKSLNVYIRSRPTFLCHLVRLRSIQAFLHHKGTPSSNAANENLLLSQRYFVLQNLHRMVINCYRVFCQTHTHYHFHYWQIIISIIFKANYQIYQIYSCTIILLQLIC